MIVNDVHSRLNATRADRLVPVDSLTALCTAITHARGSHISVAGGRHAMGGQQFASGATVLDTRPMARVLDFDQRQGLIEVEAGIQWPELVDYLLAAQQGRVSQWGIAQKQTGANFFTVGGSVSANCHGRGLTMAPIVHDVESLRLVRTDGSVVTCSREQNPELFGLVVGGYGLFGAVYTVTLRLTHRRKLQRVVEVITVQQLVDAVAERVATGFLYGDFQFAIDPGSPDFLTKGVFSCYRPVSDSTPIPEDQRALTPDNWQALLVLAHTDKSRAFDVYARHYLATSGQVYWSDLQQLAVYLDDYHHGLDHLLDAEQIGTEMISELYVPRDRLADFMAAAADELRHSEADLIYGTVRFIERDEDTWLAWAGDSYACTVFNLHTPHTEEGVARSAAAFRRLIDLAIERGGSYYLTYHRWADRAQVSACYPQFAEFLALKRRYDPDELFSSDWYRHYATLFPAA
ncbi:MAG TPA: FAD-binding oxidoreductase [Pseudonocardiaceae bacterium]|nr:FAD-binding oxidoreductase [Pseudonocardiaceae bacterium]